MSFRSSYDIKTNANETSMITFLPEVAEYMFAESHSNAEEKVLQEQEKTTTVSSKPKFNSIEDAITAARAKRQQQALSSHVHGPQRPLKPPVKVKKEKKENTTAKPISGSSVTTSKSLQKPNNMTSELSKLQDMVTQLEQRVSSMKAPATPPLRKTHYSKKKPTL